MTSGKTIQQGVDFQPCTGMIRPAGRYQTVRIAFNQGAQLHVQAQLHTLNDYSTSFRRLKGIGKQHRRRQFLNGFVLRQENLTRQLIEKM